MIPLSPPTPTKPQNNNLPPSVHKTHNTTPPIKTPVQNSPPVKRPVTDTEKKKQNYDNYATKTARNPAATNLPLPNRPAPTPGDKVAPARSPTLGRVPPPIPTQTSTGSSNFSQGTMKLGVVPKPSWEIYYEELTLKEELGRGGFGVVRLSLQSK